MRTFFPSESYKETQLNSLNPQSWLQVERGKLSKSSSQPSSSSIESLVKVPEPPILPYFKPVDYVEALAHIHEELEICSSEERSNLYLLKFQVFRGLGEGKLMRRSLRAAWQKASSVHEKLVFGAWLKYEKQGEELITDLLGSCGKCSQEFGHMDVASMLPVDINARPGETISIDGNPAPRNVVFRIGDERIVCNRQKIAALSVPFHAMLNGCFTEALSEDIDLSENNISASGMRAISGFCSTGNLDEVPPDLLLEILVFANRFCCESLKVVCDRKLACLVSSRDDAVELMDYALEEDTRVLAASCLQVFLKELPDCLSDERVIRIFSNSSRHQRLIMAGPASFSLYCLLSEVAMNLDPRSDKTACFLERMLESAENDNQRLLAFHHLACVKLLRNEFVEAERLFDEAFKAGHVYSVVGSARLSHMRGQSQLAYEKLSSVISSQSCPLGWMHQERSLYCEGAKKWEDLESATKLDPTLPYPYMYRAASLMKN